MAIRLELARDQDAAAIAALRLAAARDLTLRHGEGTWSHVAETVDGVRMDRRSANVLVARMGPKIVATLRLSAKNPWMGDSTFFTPCSRPVYLTSMAVLPACQRQGIGRQFLEEATLFAARWPADAIRLDSYDAPAGAGGFYARCGFREVRRGDYFGMPLIWFERLIREGKAS